MQVSTRGKIAIIGQGYVGLPLAMAAAESGWEVVGVDSSKQVVKNLNEGLSHIEDISNQRLLGLLNSKRYRATDSYAEIKDASVCVICVPTPLSSEGTPDITFLESAVKAIAPYLSSGTLLVNESTSYPGTLRDLIMKLVATHRDGGTHSICFASAPERIDPQNKNWDLFSTPRLVSGIDEQSRTLAREFYSTFCKNVVEVSSPEVAELAKLLENTFRQVNIALVNQLVPFCNEIGVDVREVIDAAGTKPYGFMKFFPGAGVGGHCIPVDPMYLLWKSKQLGIDLPFIEKADEVNGGMPSYVVDRLIQLTKGRESRNFLIYGMAYKPGVADTREAPAMDVAQELKSRGFQVFYVDPLVDQVPGVRPYAGEDLRGAIVVTAQPGMSVKELTQIGVPILDCTGEFRQMSGVIRL